MNRLSIKHSLTQVVCLIALMSMSAQSFAIEAVAMITDITGTCALTSQGKAKECKILTYLSTGDKIALDSGSKLTLAFFADSKEYAFSGKSTIQINDKTPQVLAGPKAKPRTLLLAKETGLGPTVSSDYGQAAIVLRGFGKNKKLTLLRPKNTNVLNRRPEFAWKPFSGSAQYRFVLSDESGRILVDATTAQPQFQLAQGKLLDEDVYYTWQVEAQTASGEKFSSSADFLVVKKAERERIEKLRPAKTAPLSERVLFAAVLEQSGFKDAALQQWQMLAAERPNDPILKAKAER